MPNGDLIQDGVAFVDIRSNYKSDPMYLEAEKYYKQDGVVVRNAQTNNVTILVPFSVEEFLCQIQGLCCTILHISALCTSAGLIRSFTSCQITCRNATTCCIVNQSVCQRRYASEVAVAIANDSCLQVGIFLIFDLLCSRSWRFCK